MTPRIARRTTVLALLMGCAAIAEGQTATAEVTLDQALELFVRHSPEFQFARSQLAASVETARQGRAIPNPAAGFSHEDLGAYSESYLLVTQGLGFLWEQGPKRRRSEARAAVARARFVADSVRLTGDLKRTYLDAWEAREVLSTLDLAYRTVARTARAAEARVSEGDLAGYDLRRLRWEEVRMRRRVALAELDLEQAERRLGSSLTEDDAGLRARSAGLDPTGPPPIEHVDLSEVARTTRAELRAEAASLEALEADASLAGLSWLSGTAATGGLKRQSDGLNGWFVGFEVPLPLTDRRRATARASRASTEAARARIEALRRAITRQVARAEARLESAKRQSALLHDEPPGEAQSLLDIARVAYEEGEVGIVELLDATRAFVEARLVESQILAEVWAAYFELEAAVGDVPSSNQRGGSDR